MNDSELLRAYVEGRSNEAFKTLIDRHIRLVYAACWRQLRDRHLAEDATQGVFIILSQKAGKLRLSSLEGWLLTTARYACCGIRRAQTRQLRRERAAAMTHDGSTSGASQSGEGELLDLLDEGLCRLGSAEREAIALRYLQEQPLKAVGEATGVSEEAARKRVVRGIDKLRRFFLRRGVNASAAVLIAVLADQARGVGLPAGVEESIAHGVLQACQAGAGSTTTGALIAKGAMHMMFLAKLKTAGVAAALLATLTIFCGWMATRADKTSAAETAVAPGVVVAATAPAAVPDVDLSTPETAFVSFCRALKAGDRTMAYACLAVDTNRPTTLVDAGLECNLAENRMLRVARKAFGEAAETLQDGITADAIGELLMATGVKAQVDGDAAAMRFSLPPVMLKLLPAEVKLWIDKPLRFKKENGKWRIDIDRTATMSAKLFGDNPADFTPGERQERTIGVMRGLASAQDEIARRIEQGELIDMGTTRNALQAKYGTLMRKYGITGCSINAVPADVPEEER